MLRSDMRRNSASYSDEEFEKDDDDAGWTRISIKDIDMGREIGGGGVALVYEGHYQRTRRPQNLIRSEGRRGPTKRISGRVAGHGVP